MEVGPVLGILSTPKAQSAALAGNQSESFAELISLAERMNCIAFVFHPLDIDFTKNAVWGYRYNSLIEPGEWERHLYPLPSVIYNRIPNRTLENREDIKHLLSVLKKKYRGNFFNPSFLDKWKTHIILSNNKQTKEFLPKTARLNNPVVISEMLSNFRSVYLKPCANSLGNDILKVTKKEGQYHFIHQCLNQDRREGVLPKCKLIISELPADNSGYLVQQDIKLAKYMGRAFDLRLLAQKNSNGEWCKTGLAARIAGEGSITTHVFYGGTRSSAESVIKNASANYGFSFSYVQKQLKRIHATIPQVIENAYGESFGEIEMDLGIDRKGKVWFLEANSKPFRFDEPLIRAKSLVRLISYVRYLDSKSV